MRIRNLMLMAVITMSMEMAFGTLQAHASSSRMDWSQVIQNSESLDGEKVQVKGYIHEQNGQMYLTAMAGGACCSSSDCQNKIHLVGAKENFSMADPQKPVVVEGSVKKAGSSCTQASCHDEESNHPDEEACGGCLGKEKGGCCAIVDMEDPYLVDDDGATKTYTGGVVSAILLGVALVIGYQMFFRRKS